MTTATVDIEALRAVYRNARRRGASVEDAIDAAWREARKALPRARAPYGVEKLSINTGSRRAYRSPLGDVLGVTGEFGHHCAKWRRTARSWRERAEVRDALARALGEGERWT